MSAEKILKTGECALPTATVILNQTQDSRLVSLETIFHDRFRYEPAGALHYAGRRQTVLQRNHARSVVGAGCTKKVTFEVKVAKHAGKALIG